MRYICSRCLRSLHRDLHPRSPQRLRHAQAVRLLSSVAETDLSSQTPIKKRRNRNLQNGTEDDDSSKRLRTRSWSSLLKKKSLGQDSSVLVLRDSERKKTPQRDSPQQVDREDLTPVTAFTDANRILSSMKAQGETPNESEIFDNISALRPEPESTTTAIDGTPLLSLARYNQCVDILSKAFTRNQLKAFVEKNRTDNVDGASRTTDSGVTTDVSVLGASSSQDTDKQPEEGAVRNYLRVFNWEPYASGEQRSKKAVKRPERAGQRAARNVMRLVWGFEIIEHVSGQGSLEVEIDTLMLPILLVGGKSSTLSELSRKRGSRIEVHRNRQRIKILGSKDKCLGTVYDLDRLLYLPFVIELDIAPEIHRTILQTRRGIAEKCRCFITIQRGKLIIRGLSQQSVEMCQRLLISSIPSQTTDKSICPIVGDAERLGFLGFSTASQEALPYRLRGTKLGRYTFAKTLETDSTSSVTNDVLRDILAPETRDKIISILLEKADSDTMSETYFIAEFGHLLHPIENRKLINLIAPRELSKSATHFLPTISSLTGLRSSSFGRSDEKRREELHIRFQPSPLNLLTRGTKEYPDIEMTVSLPSEDTSQAKLRWVRAICQCKSASVMMPDSETDMHLVRLDVAYFTSDASTQPSVEEYISEINRSAAGFGKVVAPLWLHMKLPSSVFGIVSPKSDEDTNVVEYFAAEIQKRESLKLDELDYCRTEGDEVNGSFEGISYSPAVLSFRGAESKAQYRTMMKSAVDQFITEAAKKWKSLNSQTNII